MSRTKPRYNCSEVGRIGEFLLDGEPVFVLRAQDALSVDALEHYLSQVIAAGADNVEPVRASIAAFRNWQVENPRRVKRPDY